MREREIIIISIAVFFIALLLAYILASEVALSANIVFIGIIVLFVPYMIYRFLEYRNIRAYEKEFPAFLRDMSEAQRTGMSTVDAIRLAAKAEYGLLTKEIRKMNTQLSWNVPLENVLKEFRKRMKGSMVIVRALFVIEQSNKSGGDIGDTMNSLANNIEMIKNVQAEKSNLMNQQVMMMYAIFFIFLGITIILIKILIPLLQTQLSGGSLVATFSADPCSICQGRADPSCLNCDALSFVSVAFGFGKKGDPASYYKALFFVMIIVQAICSGLIAGQIGSDSVIAGIKHSMIKLLSGSFIFILIVRAGII